MNKRPKILIVDDRPENLVALTVVLKDLDIELIKAESGNDALKATLYHDFALALLDIQMPEMDGYELASILREEEKTAHLPFIFISAVYTDNLNVFKGYEKGAFSFITKPFQPEILINKVKFFIEKHQQEIDLYNLNKNLEKNNEQLSTINGELEAFTYTVSHDLRAPVRAVSGYTKMLKESYSDVLDHKGISMIQKIESSAIRMERLIDDLLAFSRLGKKSIKSGEIDMNNLVENVIQEFEKSVSHKAEFKLASLHSVHGDYNLLYQAIYNLLSNAIKYSSKEDAPIIEITSYQDEASDEIIYCIKDNGAGFEMEYAHKLFGVFERLHSDEDFEGTGVGLAIVHKIIDKHGGRIWAEGEINKGASFYFSLLDKAIKANLSEQQKKA